MSSDNNINSNNNEIKHNNIPIINNSVRDNLNLIVACDSKYGISKNNSIPWKIKEDMKYFNSITTGESNNPNVVIYGKNTWFSLKSLSLKNRINIILSSTINKNLIEDPVCTKNIFFSKNLENALNNIEKGVYGKINEVFICGGKRLYEECISENLIKTFYINKIDYDYNCDIFLDKDLMDKCLQKCNKPEFYEFRDVSIQNNQNQRIVKVNFYNNIIQ
jgi:dihydrofolate reductase